jgi:hypothetical protein
LAQANFGENQGSFEGIKAAPKNRGVCWKERKSNAEKRGKAALRKEITMWTNCCGEVGKWTRADLEQWLD